MSRMHGTDNQEQLFRFESSEDPSLPSIATPQSASDLDNNSRAMSSHDDLPTSEELNQGEQTVVDAGPKGKGLTEPMPIRTSTAIVHDLFDDMSPSGSMVPSSSRDSHTPSLLSPLTPSSFTHYPHLFNNPTQHYTSPSNLQDLQESFDLATCSTHSDETVHEKRKGKEKELPPTLPPLTFSPTEFGYGQISWPSPGLISATPGPSSYGSSYGLLSTSSTDTEMGNRDVDFSSTAQTVTLAQPVEGIIPVLKRMPSRRRSLSNLSIRSTRSLAARSMSKIKLHLGPTRMPSNLARRLLFRKREDTPDISCGGSKEVPVVDAGRLDTGTGRYITSCRTDFKLDEVDSTTTPLSTLHLQDMVSNASYYNYNHLKAKGRSNSSPFPLSALDYVPVTSTDIFAPIPLIIRNYFDEVLPQELRLHILASLIATHEADHARAIAEGRWTMAKASSSRGRWVGRDKGIRELVRLSRVSKSWQMLVFDGQLWVDLDLHSFPKMPESLLLRLTATGGPFTTRLNVAGHVRLDSVTLLDMTDNLCLTTAPRSAALPYTQLTTINLQGCTALSTRSLHYLLIRSRSLQRLCVKGLKAVTNTTCDILSTYCPQLVFLDMNRCSGMDAEGIRSIAAAATVRREHLLLKELRLSGLKHVDDATLAALGVAAPHLEVLDLSYVRHLHNSALEAFVACEDGWDEQSLGVNTILVSARDIGRDSNDGNKYRRRVTRLRHLSLTFCALLTDDACSNLAHSVPRLEFLEMAGIGNGLKDAGLVRLLNTTPYLRRLDLEDASAIGDSVIAAITPVASALDLPPLPAGAEPEPGHALEQLTISYATNVGDAALLALVRGCPRLTCLEVDNTRVGGAVLREFVRLCREREVVDARVVAIDCRGVSEAMVRELAGWTRPRKGWRAHEARGLAYLDARDGSAEDLKVGQDECDARRVVLKTFYSWQTVDVVRAAREKRRKATARRAGGVSESGGSASELEDGSGRMTRWWSPGARRSPLSGRSSPLNIADLNSDGCRMM